MSKKIDGEKQPLFTKRGKIVFCHMCSGYNLLIHIGIAVLTVMLLMKNMDVDVVGETVFTSVLVVSILIPFIVHAVYIICAQTGYAVFHADTVDVVTSFKTRTFPDNAYVFMEVKSHSFRESKIPMYYDVRLDIKTEDKVETVRLLTNQQYCFDALIKRFPEPK